MAAVYVYNVAHQRNERARRKIGERLNSLDGLTDREIISRYRLDRNSIFYLERLLSQDLSSTSNRSNPISPLTQILVGLRFLAKGDFFSEVGDLHGISKATVSTHLEPFLDSINTHLQNVRFPTDVGHQRAIMHGFYQRCGIPGVIGAIDGTLVPIKAPVHQEEAYVCRKGYHAVNVQAVVDHKMRFTDIVSKWPGSQHDSAIFNACPLKDYLEDNDVGILLGDSGYPLRRYLITPVLQPRTEQEIRFNTAHSKTRVVVERAFGVLKSRFRCLHKSGGCLPFAPSKCCKVVGACMRLHNLCLDINIPLGELGIMPVAGNDDIVIQGFGVGHQARQAIINLF